MTIRRWLNAPKPGRVNFEVFAEEIMLDIAVRKMSEDDREAVMRLLDRWNMAPRAPSPEVPDPERSTLIVENTFVAIADGQLIGCASYILHDNGFAETASLAVDPSWVGTHVGERLQRARLAEMKKRNVVRVRTESDREEIVDWYVRKFGCRIVGTARKRHAFGRPDVHHWTVLELDLCNWRAMSEPDHRPRPRMKTRHSMLAQHAAE